MAQTLITCGYVVCMGVRVYVRVRVCECMNVYVCVCVCMSAAKTVERTV